MSNANAEIGY
jgi:murein DD-endopeptidase MepM/ murein hydrolase activator NlpD